MASNQDLYGGGWFAQNLPNEQAAPYSPTALTTTANGPQGFSSLQNFYDQQKAAGGTWVDPASPAVAPINATTGQYGTPGPSQQADSSFGQYGSNPAVTALQQALQHGLTGQGAVDYVNQAAPGSGLVYDPTRGNYDLGTGGSSGLQFDTNAQGVWGAHQYNDGGSSGGGGNATNFASALGPQSGNFNYPAFNEMFTPPKWTQTFAPPTGVSDSNDPGYSARLAAGTSALQNSAAAKGTLLTTGTSKDLTQFGQDYASNEYGNVYNRALTTYNTNYQGFLNDYQQQLQKFQQDYGVYQGGFSNALATQQSNTNQNLQGAYLNLFGQNQNFGQQFNLAQLGYNAAANANNNQTSLAEAQANTYLNQGNTNAGYYSNAGNTQSAGTIAGGNNAANALTNLSNSALYGYYANQGRSGYQPPGGPGFGGQGSFY